MPEAVLEADAVTRRFRNGRGVGPVSLGLFGGDVLAVLGPNGSGKTTLFRCLATRSRCDAGEIRWFGERDPLRARRRLGVVFDATAHVDELSGAENAAFFARTAGAKLTAAALAGAELDQVAAEAVSSYSYGMRRRLILAEALLCEPDLLVLDEPTLGLDVTGRAWLSSTLAQRSKRGLAAVVSTNDTEFVESVATRVAFLVEGRLVADSPLGALLESVGGLREVQLRCRSAVDESRLQAVAGVETVVAVAGGYAVLAQRRDGLVADLLSAVGDLDRTLEDLSVREPGLADCFLRLTGRALHD